MIIIYVYHKDDCLTEDDTCPCKPVYFSVCKNCDGLKQGCERCDGGLIRWGRTAPDHLSAVELIHHDFRNPRDCIHC